LTGEKLLLHVCCAPCSTVVQDSLGEEGWALTAFFHNPNIHPWSEWKRRLDAVTAYTEQMEIPLETDLSYPLEENLMLLLGAARRCQACFAERLHATAVKAAALGIRNFSTTLSVSPYQDQELITASGESAAAATGTVFVYRDFRNRYRESVRLSREQGQYRQPYCGCVMSERDRYSPRG
jgi:predicted adenine nucleotide alpha hydrolase (AANH) superfamily ATPase